MTVTRIAELVDQIDCHLVVANEEMRRLIAAREALVDTPQRPPASRPRIAIPNGASTDRALALITNRPGVKAGAIGPLLGMSGLAGYGLANKLREAGLAVKAADGGWFPK